MVKATSNRLAAHRLTWPEPMGAPQRDGGRARGPQEQWRDTEAERPEKPVFGGYQRVGQRLAEPVA